MTIFNLFCPFFQLILSPSFIIKRISGEKTIISRLLCWQKNNTLCWHSKLGNNLKLWRVKDKMTLTHCFKTNCSYEFWILISIWTRQKLTFYCFNLYSNLSWIIWLQINYKLQIYNNLTHIFRSYRMEFKIAIY